MTERSTPKTEQWGGPSFSLACTMVPFHSTNLSSSLHLHLPSTEEIEKQAKSRKLPANTNRARDEVQYELAFLQGKVAELEQQLKKLHLHNSNMTPRRDLSMPAVPTQLVQVLRVWKEISTRQRRRRDEAQRENARLRRVVERKKKLATGLSTLLRKQLTQEGVLRLAEEKQNTTERRTTCVLDFRGDIGEFQDLF
ncbi:hypothetical protein V7S43_004059 [Phytophthora oleae]|uniref:Uncharacterized protein n=1 Tax=Phytophthora oleae TaxID=2107226 RepID=A0ABD3FXD6_9STRA